MISSIHIEYLVDIPECIPTIAQWRHEQWGYVYPERTVKDFEIKLRENLSKNKMPLFIVAVSDSKPLGVASLLECDTKGWESLCPWLGSLLVEKDYRNQGVGKLLIQEIIRIAHSMGFESLYLRALLPIESYYKNLQWETINQTHYQNEEVVIMKLALK